MQLTARNATLADLAELLGKQQARKLDAVLPAAALHACNGDLVVDSDEAHIDDTGVWPLRGTYVPTALVDEHIAEKLNVPLAYLRRLREQRVDLYDATVNGFLHGGEWTIDRPGGVAETHMIPADARSFMLRMFRGEFGNDAEPGVARALLSDRFRIVDNFDVLTAALEGVQAAGVAVEIDGCDLTDRRMYVRIAAPEIAALAPDLLAGYRSPFGHDAGHNGWTLEAARRAAEREGQSYAPGTEPIVFAGFVLSNSETGGGAFSLTPRIIVSICRNGLTITRDALRNVHVGGKLDAGIIKWSDDTQRKNLELVTSQTRDAVSTFLDVDYVRGAVASLTEQAVTPLDKPADAVKIVAKQLAFSAERTEAVLDHFIRGGQMTAGGIMQAVTSVAQTIDDADAAAEFENAGVQALALAASL